MAKPKEYRTGKVSYDVGEVPVSTSQPATTSQNTAYTSAISQMIAPVQFTPSQSTTDYQNALANIEANAPAPYQSQYGGKIGEILAKIANREPFSYDFNADPIYQQYKDQYVKLGNEASMNAAANVAALTGGFGNSYATTAASQANQQYLTALNNIIPELSSQAYDRYRQEGEDLMNLYGLYGNEEDRAYGQYRDTVGDYQANRGYYQGAAQNALANDQWQASFAQAQAEYEQAYQQWAQEFAYQQGRDQVADDQWNQSFAYQQARDQIADSQWNQQFEYQQSRDQVADSQWQQSFNQAQTEYDRAYQQALEQFAYQQQRDQVADSQWQQSFNQSASQYAQNLAYQRERANASDEQWAQEFAYQQSRDAVSDSQWAQELALRQAAQDAKGGMSSEQVQAMIEEALKVAMGLSGAGASQEEITKELKKRYQSDIVDKVITMM